MKKIFRTLPILLLVFVAAPYAYAGLSESCYPAVQCNPGDDYYGSSCQAHIESVSGSSPNCTDVNGAPASGKQWAFNCTSGCYQSSIPTPSLCPGGIMVGGDCLTQLTVLDDDVPVTGETAYKIWDGIDLTEIVHVNTAGCADDEIAISDASEPTGWKCGPGSSLWSENGSDIYYETGKVGIGTNLPTSTLDVVVEDDTPGASIGQDTVATGAFAVAMGLNATAQPFSSTVIGRYNVVSGNETSWVMTDPLFVVGNGTGDSDRSNAMTILKNGNVGIDVDNPTVPLHVGDGPDCTLASGGIILTNYTSANNLCIDRKGIIARANGSNSDLNIQSTGGRTLFNGDVLIGTTSNPNLAPFRVDDGTYNVDLLGGGIFGTVGVSAKGSSIGGVFINAADTTSYAWLSADDVGIHSAGASKGGQFEDTNGTGSASVAYGNTGIYAEGSWAGANFDDTNSDDVEVWLANGFYSILTEGPINISESSSPALYVSNIEALWYGGGQFSWGYGGTLNYFADKMGIGTNSVNYMLEVNGTAGKTGGGSWSNSSDIRLKDIQGEYKKGLNEIVKLKPVEYRYKVDNPKELPSDEDYIGFVAQDVQPVFPEAIAEDDDGYLSFNMHSINVAIVNAVQELKAENDALKSVVCELKPDAEICNQ